MSPVRATGDLNAARAALRLLNGDQSCDKGEDMDKEMPSLGPAFNVALWVAVVVWALASTLATANQLIVLFGAAGAK